MECAKCKGGRLSRVERKGFLEKYVYSLFGVYPWRCSLCKTHVHLKNRGERKRRSEEQPIGSTYVLKRDADTL